jgi:hypothetical protein
VWVAFVAAVAVAAGVANKAASPGLRSVDWSRVTVPAVVCGAARPIKLGPLGTIVSSGWKNHPRVYVNRSNTVVYGDLNGDARDEAAIQVYCAIPYGTAASQLAFAVVVYAARPSGPRAIGVLRPQTHLPRPGPHHCTIALPVSITLHRIKVTEVLYGSHDSEDAGTGLAVTIWTYAAGRFRVLSNHVVRAPNL